MKNLMKNARPLCRSHLFYSHGLSININIIIYELLLLRTEFVYHRQTDIVRYFTDTHLFVIEISEIYVHVYTCKMYIHVQ